MHLKCLYTNTCSLGNKQEELELHVWTQNCEIIGIFEKWWDSSYGWRSDRKLAALGETQARKKRRVVALFGSEHFTVKGILWKAALNVKAAGSVEGHQDCWGLEHMPALHPGRQKVLGIPNSNLPESVRKLARRQSQGYS